MGTSGNSSFSYSHNNLNKIDKKHENKVVLDQAFEKITVLQKGNLGKSSIVSKFGFICEPLPGVEIKGGTPKVVTFSENICSTSDMGVVFLALVLSELLSWNKTNKLQRGYI